MIEQICMQLNENNEVIYTETTRSSLAFEILLLQGLMKENVFHRHFHN
jgi:hypothetical protein